MLVPPRGNFETGAEAVPVSRDNHVLTLLPEAAVARADPYLV